MREKPTNELDEMLKNLSPNRLSDYYKENREYIADADKSFTYYMKDVIDKKNINLGKEKIRYRDIYLMAGISDSYGDKVLNMRKPCDNRDLIIRLCIAGRFLLNETNTALKLHNMKPLYAKDKRDACIIVAINNRKYNLLDIDDMLEMQGFEKLSSE